jgi:hypothetical protein
LPQRLSALIILFKPASCVAIRNHGMVGMRFSTGLALAFVAMHT